MAPHLVALAATDVPFTRPHLEYAQLWPILVVLGVACIGIVVEAFAPREARHHTQVALSSAGLVAALVGTVIVGTRLDVVDGGSARGFVGAQGSVVLDGPTVYLWGLVLVFGITGVALFSERRLEVGVSAFAGQAAALPGSEAEREASARGLDHTEVYPLLMFAVAGMMLFPAAGDLITLFVGLEVLSLPLYLLCGLARRRRLLSQEAAMKYFLLGAFSSAFLLYGIALLYGYAGSMSYATIGSVIAGNDAGRGGNHTLLLMGLGLVAVGLLFKVGAVPFHSWTPDVYQGAPTAVTAWMSAATKIAAFGAVLRLFYVALGPARTSWQPMMWTIAILTMVVGAVLAIVQTDVKRMLAYSSVAHTGFLLTGVLGVQSASALASGQITSLQAVLFYLTVYGFAMVGSFGIVTLVRGGTGGGDGEVTTFAAWTGLGRRSPLIAGLFAFFLLSMAGIPLTAGFIGKWAVFTVALSSGAWPVVLVAIAASIVSVFFYVRFIRVMFFTEPAADQPVADVAAPSLLTSLVIAICAAATLVLGIVPGPVLDLAARAGDFVR